MARITDVWAVIPKGTNEPQDWRTWMAQILVVVECDDGTRGFGVGGGGKAGIHIIDTVLREVVVGRDPRTSPTSGRAMYAPRTTSGARAWRSWRSRASIWRSGICWASLRTARLRAARRTAPRARADRTPRSAPPSPIKSSAGIATSSSTSPAVKESPDEIVEIWCGRGASSSARTSRSTWTPPRSGTGTQRHIWRRRCRAVRHRLARRAAVRRRSGGAPPAWRVDQHPDRRRRARVHHLGIPRVAGHKALRGLAA